MSLKVWLPLTEDTRNQGLLNLPTPWDARIKDTGGKLGQYCYSDNAIYHIENEWLGNEWSLACWVKSSSWTQYNDIILCKNTTSSGNAQFYLSIVSGTWLNIGCNAGAETLKINYTFVTDTWYHVAATYDGTILKLYLNGSEVGAKAYTSTQKTGMNNLGIGCRSANAAGTSPTGGGNKRMNDVRIYDHALSPLEIKHISQGLILHYPLNRNGWGQENLLVDTYNWSTLTSASTVSERYWYSNGGTAVRGYDNINNITYCKIWHSDNSSWTRYSRQYITMQPNTYYTVSILCRINTDIAHLSIRNDRSEAITFFASNVELTNKNWEWKFFTAKTHTNTSQEPFTIYAQVNSDGVLSSDTSIDIAMIKLEKGSLATPWCPNSSDAFATTIGLNDNILYDTSGYGNNGTRTGTFSWTSDTPKYQVSTKFNTTSTKIKLPVISFTGMANSYTFAWWQYNISTGNMPWGFSDGNRLNCYHCSPLCWNTGDGSRNQFKDGSATVTPATIQNGWHHMVITGDGTATKLYIDGVYKGTAITYKPLTGTQIWISGWDSGTLYTFNGSKECDFRIYATALSADDVKSLYNNSAYIDNQGNIYGAVYEEV